MERPVEIVLKVNGGANSGHTAGGLKLNLLPAGVIEIKGRFNRGDIISIKSKLVSTFAWGISNYSSNDIKLIKGKDSKNITELINKKYEPEIIHRDNLVISRES